MESENEKNRIGRKWFEGYLSDMLSEADKRILESL